MPLAFSHYSVVLKRKSIVDKVLNNQSIDKHLLKISKNLIESNFSDDYLIGIESLNENLNDELALLKKLGLNWNDGFDCLDFFIPSLGTATATWLNFERLRINNVYYSVYSHIDDLKDDITSFDSSLTIERKKNLILLNRRNWALIAKDELNRLYSPSLAELKNEISCNNRVCPIPKLWNELHEIAIAGDINESPPPPLPLILGGWWESIDSEKSARLYELIKWAFDNNASDVVWAYLKLLSENDWHHSDV